MLIDNGGRYMDIDSIWNLIKMHAGEKFYTATGLEFTYVMLDDNTLQPYRDGETRWKMNKSLFEKALMYRGNFSSKEFNNKIIGSSYVRGILEDSRILG